jgi:hypothetical protein
LTTWINLVFKKWEIMYTFFFHLSPKMVWVNYFCKVNATSDVECKYVLISNLFDFEYVISWGDILVIHFRYRTLWLIPRTHTNVFFSIKRTIRNSIGAKQLNYLYKYPSNPLSRSIPSVIIIFILVFKKLFIFLQRVKEKRANKKYSKHFSFSSGLYILFTFSSLSKKNSKRFLDGLEVFIHSAKIISDHHQSIYKIK